MTSANHKTTTTTDDNTGNSYKAFEQLMMMTTEQQRQQHIIHHYQTLTDRLARRLEHSQQDRHPFSQCIAHSHDQHNRYCDIIPYDYNRVMLTQPTLGPTGEFTDYINASWISFLKKKRYIATQGPLPSTCGDFWRMVLEHDVKVIVCLTPEIEHGRAKCAPYWPQQVDQVARFELEDGDDDNQRLRRRSFSHHLLYTNSKQKMTSSATTTTTTTTTAAAAITWTMEVKHTQPEYMDQDAACLIRSLEVTCYRNQQQQRKRMASTTVHQLHYQGWADHGVPQETHTLNALIQLANRLQPPQNEPPPMVVHCSAGCGRTGTFCVVDTGLTWLGEMKRNKNNKKPTAMMDAEVMDAEVMDPIYQMTDVFRQQRTTMVQTLAQYLFCYRAIWDQLQQQQLD